MQVEGKKFTNLPDEGTVTLGAPHPGLSVFQDDNAMQYFNKEFILKEELKEDNIEYYLKNRNICFAMEKIYDNQIALSEQCNPCNDSRSMDVSSDVHHLNSTGGANSTLSKHNQLIERFYLDLSLPESDFGSSVCVTLSTSVTSTPSKSQDESTNNITFEREEVSATANGNCDTSTADLVSLFWLMSILPDPWASQCKEVLDRDQFAWKVTLYDVILVLLNWGATPQTLGLENMNLQTTLYSSQLQTSCTPKDKFYRFPAPSNVVLVLNSISQRLPVTVSPCSQRALLVKVLVYAALDQAHRRYQTQYCRTIRCVLKSYLSWGPNEANVIVNLLQLECIGLQNSVFVCCSFFNMTSDRLSLVGSLASHKVLHQQFGLPAEASLCVLIKNLLCPSALLKRFELWHIYIITCHVHSLLVRDVRQTQSCSQEDVVALQQWTMEVRSALTQHPYMYTLASNHVRERLARLTAECATIVRTGQLMTHH